MTRHFFYCPFTGLGLYNGFRGNRWLRNRIKIFKQFVVPSLQAQTNHNFTLWISWRPEERNNKYVKDLMYYMTSIPEFSTVHTFKGLCFYDDKYEDKIAQERLVENLHLTMGELFDAIGDVDNVLMTIQPSDDCYERNVVDEIQKHFMDFPEDDAVGFERGYICNYNTKQVAEYNPNTNPPFYTIKFTKEIFTDPFKHARFTGLKKDVGKYKKGTPLPSHEYVGDCLKYATAEHRGFLVGCHGENISTYYDHPFKGQEVDKEVLKGFGIYEVSPVKFNFSFRKWLLRKLPHRIRRKLRYWNEKLYNWIRS